MFRVPKDSEKPTFDHTFKVGFFRWLTSKGGDRVEWMRRRRIAAERARLNQNARVQAFVDRKVAGVVERAEQRAAAHVASGTMTPEMAEEAVRRVRKAAVDR